MTRPPVMSPQIPRGESEPVGPPPAPWWHMPAMAWVMLLVMVVCVGGAGAPLVLLGWWLGAFDGPGTALGASLVAIGALVGLTVGIALVEPTLDRVTRWLRLDQ